MSLGDFIVFLLSNLGDFTLFLLCKFPFILAAMIAVCTLVKHSIQRRAEIAAQEEQAHAEREKARKAEEQRQEKERQAQQEKAAKVAAAAQKKQEQAAKRAERERRAAEAHALKVARAAELAQIAERELAARKALAAMKQQTQKTEETPAAPSQKAPAQEPAQKQQEPSLTLDQFSDQNAPKPFCGQKVAFTGRLSGMTRAQAIEKVRQAGGQGYEKGMPVGTTLLVVGALKNDGCSQKLDKADEWIGQVRKITEAQFLEMLAA